MKKKYVHIFDELADKIKDGKLQAGSLLPSENELTSQYKTSRETIRKALNLLSEHGYIQKIQGKGSVVLDIGKLNFPVSGLVSFKEIAEKMGERVMTEVVIFRDTPPPSSIQQELSIDETQLIWEIFRIREIDGEKVILDKDYILKDEVPGLTIDICKQSIYEYIEETLGRTISYAKKEITVETPTDEDRHYLDVKYQNNIVVVKNHVYFEDTTLFQFTESRHRPDRFRFVDFARRNR